MRIEAGEGSFIEIRVDYDKALRPEVKIIAHTDVEIVFIPSSKILRLLMDEIDRAIRVLDIRDADNGR